MSRRKVTKKKFPAPDCTYNSYLVTILISRILKSGKKTLAQTIVNETFDVIKYRLNLNPVEVFETAVKNVTPIIEVKARRFGGATYQVPVEVKSKRSQALALRWLIDASRKRKDKNMSDKIFNEIYDAYQNKGSAIKKKEDTHKMAESNKAFAHFRW